MKSLNNFFLALLIMLVFFISFYEGLTQPPCPAGWTQSSLTFTKTSGTMSCEIEVNFCFKCDPLGNEAFQANINYIRAYNYDCYIYMSNNSRQLFRESADLIVGFADYWCTIPPCNQYSETAIVNTAICNSLRTNTDGSRDIFSCNMDSYCKYVYSICVDYNQSPPTLSRTLNYVTQYGTPSCTLSRFDVPPPPPGSSSECFVVPCQ